MQIHFDAASYVQDAGKYYLLVGLALDSQMIPRRQCSPLSGSCLEHLRVELNDLKQKWILHLYILKSKAATRLHYILGT